MSKVIDNIEDIASIDTKVDKVTSTDNAIARYDGTGGAIQNSSVIIDDSGNLTTAGIIKGLIGKFNTTSGAAYLNVSNSTDNADIFNALDNTDVVFTIKDAGNVGIGTSSPSRKFEVVGDTSLLDYTSTNQILLTQIGDSNRVYSRVKATSADFPLSFWTGTTERMRINSAGNVLIGTTSYSGTTGTYFDGAGRANLIQSSNELNIFDGTSVDTECYVAYRALANGGQFTAYRFMRGDAGHNYATLHAAAFSVASDYRLKENFTEILDATDRVKALKTYRFNFIDGSGMADTGTVDGFIAHEVQDIVPEAVYGKKDGTRVKYNDDGTEEIAPAYQGLDQSKLVPLLTKALQEAIERIEQLETRITTLEGGN